MNLNDLINDNNVLNIYERDSYLYGTNHSNSDRDYIIVVEDLSPYINKFQHVKDEDDFIFYSVDQWINKSKKLDVEFIECTFAPEKFIIKQQLIFPININENLRKSFSATASNSWVKCKKKLTLDKDYAPYIGRKSMWHSLRILMFAIDVLNNQRINYQQANDLYTDIVNSEKNWDELKEKYQSLYNQLKSRLRQLDAEENYYELY